MFNNLFDIWKGKDFLESVEEDFSAMLEISSKMFKNVKKFISAELTDSELQQEIYDMDKDINNLERKIRKRILEHMAMQPSCDVSASLILMSVIKDAERLGDYLKNIAEVRTILNGKIDEKCYNQFFGDLEYQITGMFVAAKKAFVDSDTDLAKEVGKKKTVLGPKCEDIIQDIANSDMPARDAVAYALIARYCKRLVAHLGNIATSVILPFEELDYYRPES